MSRTGTATPRVMAARAWGPAAQRKRSAPAMAAAARVTGWEEGEATMMVRSGDTGGHDGHEAEEAHGTRRRAPCLGTCNENAQVMSSGNATQQ